MSVDYSLDRIGERLAHPEREPQLSADDQARVDWVVETAASYLHGAPYIVDVGSSDGAVISRVLVRLLQTHAFCIEPHPAHGLTLPKTLREFDVEDRAWCRFDRFPCPTPVECQGALLTEVLEHWEPAQARSNLEYLRMQLAPRSFVVVTVPNADDVDFANSRRRSTWPDHRMFFYGWSLHALLETCGYKVRGINRIVPTDKDERQSIWLGCVAQVPAQANG
jgi:hypothetical protein